MNTSDPSSVSPAVKTGASFARGASKQDYATPRDLLRAVRDRFGAFDFDLAATYDNAVADRFFGPPEDVAGYDVSNDKGCAGVDALAQSWNDLAGHLWLNPPFDRIRPWAARCAERRRTLLTVPEARISFLVPASVGSEWWAEYVHGVARVHFLSPRLSFDGKNPYPKDCALCRYGDPPGYECWRWK